MEGEVKIRQRDTALVVSKRLPVRVSEIGGVIGAAFGEVYGYLGAHGGEPHGEPFIIYHDKPIADDPFDIEICAPVSRATDPPEGWRMQELPAGTFVSLLHVGPYDSLGAAYDTLTRWIDEHDLSFAGPPREVYLSEPETPPDRVKTIVEFPVSEAISPVTTG